MSARPAPLAGFRRVLLLAGLFMMLVQIHRASGAVIAAELAARGLPPSDIATVVSALFLAAALFQLPTGIAFDRYGARATLCGMGLVGVAGIVLFALSDDVLGLALGRFLIGLGHGGTIAGIYLLALTWVPPDRVSTMTGGVVAIAGGAGGYFRPGRYVHYPQTTLQTSFGKEDLVGPAHERLNVNLMHAMGMTNRSSFGLEQVDIGGRTISLRDPLPRLT